MKIKEKPTLHYLKICLQYNINSIVDTWLDRRELGLVNVPYCVLTFEVLLITVSNN